MRTRAKKRASTMRMGPRSSTCRPRISSQERRCVNGRCILSRMSAEVARWCGVSARVILKAVSDKAEAHRVVHSARHIRTLARARTHTHAHTHSLTHTRARAHTPPPPRPPEHAHIRARIHPHTHTHPQRTEVVYDYGPEWQAAYEQWARNNLAAAASAQNALPAGVGRVCVLCVFVGPPGNIYRS